MPFREKTMQQRALLPSLLQHNFATAAATAAASAAAAAGQLVAAAAQTESTCSGGLQWAFIGRSVMPRKQFCFCYKVNCVEREASERELQLEGEKKDLCCPVPALLLLLLYMHACMHID